MTDASTPAFRGAVDIPGSEPHSECREVRSDGDWLMDAPLFNLGVKRFPCW